MNGPDDVQRVMEQMRRGEVDVAAVLGKLHRGEEMTDDECTVAVLGVLERRAAARAELPAPTIPEGLLFTFESQARQYDKVGKPGLTYERHYVTGAFDENGEPCDAPVDCLLYRNLKGHLIGILNHYPATTFDSLFMVSIGHPTETAGNVNVWVRPDRQKRGVGTKLITEAYRRWPTIDPMRQRYTPAGRAWAARLAEQLEALSDGGDRDA